MRWSVARLFCAGMLAGVSMAVPARAQVEFMGRVWIPRHAGVAPATQAGLVEDYFKPGRAPDPAGYLMLSNVRCFASSAGSAGESLAFRTWELAPTGWYRMSGPPGDYTLLFTGPSVCVRPTIVTNLFMRQGERVDRKVTPTFDFASLEQGEWDDKAATDYFQTFTARGTGVTNVGFRVVHDGVDGGGPGAQDLLVSIHRRGAGLPETWAQVGPAVPVPNVDAGGPKCPDFSAAWNSGEVPTTPGETYAVHLRSAKPGGTFQMYWRTDGHADADCYRLGARGATGWRERDLCLYVAGDSDGLLIPYNKHVQKEYGEFCGFARKWCQTYVAQGHGLAGVVLYAATSGIQPGIQRQRAVIRVRRDGPAGPVIGVEKIAIGNGIHTGDAAWGTFGGVFAPGEVPLEPGRMYAIELESIENHESLHGYVNIKNMVSDDKPGFNPYRRQPQERDEPGAAYKNGEPQMDYDLDMQIVEYREPVADWDRAVEPGNLLANGDFASGTPAAERPDRGTVEAWKPFASEPKTTLQYLTDGADADNRILRVLGGGATGAVADGGWVQRVGGLSHLDTFRLAARVRCSWPLDLEHAAWVGYDLTGQDTDPKAATIVWTPFPGLHSVWVDTRIPPVRPARDAISVWVRGWTKMAQGYPFRADFDDLTLRRVQTCVPGTPATRAAPN
jgi:hypothetical protein